MKKHNDNPIIIIAEDDPEQMELLIIYAQTEVTNLLETHHIDDAKKQKLLAIQIAKVMSIDALKTAVATNNKIILAILDGFIPDSKGQTAHDQLMKTNHRITGQHKSVELVIKRQPSTPITMISSMNRFQKIVTQYYEKHHQLSVNFISKKDQATIQRNIRYYLIKYLRSST